MSTPWSHLRSALAALGPGEAPPRGARVGAALALLAEAGDGDLELLLTRRREDLQHHPGQVSFPGGRVEPGETVEHAALREAAEECGLDPATVEVLGVLPAFYIPPSRFWMQVVVARWRAPHALHAAEGEVAEILRVRLSRLRDRRRWRVVRRLRRAHSWAWQLDGDHLLWGATGAVTAALLDLLDPGWHGGQHPADLPGDRDVEPWVHPHGAVPRRGPPQLPGVPEVPLPQARPAEPAPPGPAPGVGPPAPLEPGARGPGTAEAAVEVAAAAAGQLLPAGGGVLVLAGTGRTGALGLRVAARLLERGADVRVVLASGRVHASGARARAVLDGRAGVFDGSLPRADLVVDALLGRGLRGPLRPPAQDVVSAFRGHPARVVSLDVPSGLDPVDGLVGDTVAADATLALGALPPGLLRAGLAPFVGDLYLVNPVAGRERRIVRVVPGEDQAATGAASASRRTARR